MKFKDLLRLLRNPVFVFVRTPWIERGELLHVVDICDSLDGLKRKGNEKTQYVLIGFKVNPND